MPQNHGSHGEIEEVVGSRAVGTAQDNSKGKKRENRRWVDPSGQGKKVEDREGSDEENGEGEEEGMLALFLRGKWRQGPMGDSSMGEGSMAP